MTPGEHFVVIGGPEVGLAGRHAGLHVRDALLVLLPGPRTLTAWLFRRPLGGTVVENVLGYGVGGLNIDGCRIGWDAKSLANDTLRRKTARTDIRGGSFHATGGKVAGYVGEAASPSGRWPTNLVLVHGAGCQEAVPAWACEPGCPVPMLDAQAKERGVHGAGNKKAFHTSASTYRVYGKWSGRPNHNPDIHADGHLGTASRFFPQFASLPECVRWLGRLVGS